MTSRVYAGWVWVDGTLRMTPFHVNALSPGASATINVAAGSHQLRVLVVGLATSHVTVRIHDTVTTANLATARANHTATLMPDGKVLIAGGEGAAGVLNSVERINAGGDAVSASAPLSVARGGHTATLIPGGIVLVAGGGDASGNLAGVELLTPSGSAAGLPLDEAHRGHTATTLLDGRILILGGRTAADVPGSSGVIIDPRPDAFSDDRYDAAAASATSLGSVLQESRAATADRCSGCR